MRLDRTVPPAREPPGAVPGWVQDELSTLCFVAGYVRTAHPEIWEEAIQAMEGEPGEQLEVG